MDVVKKKEKKKISKPLVAIVVGVVSLFAWLWLQPKASESIERDSLVVDEVKRGDFNVLVTGFGSLRSHKQTMLTTRDAATVEQVLLRPGAMVEPGSVIVVLQNPELEQRVTDAEVAWQQQQSFARQQKLNNVRELLAAEANIADVSADHAVVRQRLTAYEELAKQGVVSKLEHQAAELNEQQLRQKLVIEKKRLKQLSLLHSEAENIQQELILQKQNQYERVVARLDALTVRSPSKGILQRMPVELGQSLISGEQLALIGSVDELVAMVKVAQREVTQVQVGQAAEMELDGYVIDGVVTRIDPAVQENGMVHVEVELTGELPASARPERLVDTTITTASLSDVYYIKRPTAGRKNSTSFMYKVTDSGALQRRAIEFGDASLNEIHLVSGVSEGERYVLSDMSDFQGLETVAVR